MYAYDTRAEPLKLLSRKKLKEKLIIKQKKVLVNKTSDGVRLQDELELNGHLHTTINYLKVHITTINCLFAVC